jgi:cobalt-zinc-cadmium efflux system outer membrane protein
MKDRVSHYIWPLMVFTLMLPGIIQADQEDAVNPFQEKLSEQIDLPTLIQLAYERNPRIESVRTEWQATVEKLPQIASLPDPMLMYGYFLRNVETRVGPQRHRLSFSQSFPYPGTLNAAGKVQIKQIEIQEKKYEQTVRDIIVDIKLSYHELAYLERAIQITSQNQDILDHIVEITSTRYAQDEATFTDLMKAQSQQAQLSYDLVLLRELKEVEQANIRALLNLPADTPLGLPAPVPYAVMETSLDELSKRALEKRQEIQIAELMTQKAEEGIQLARMQNKPMFKLELMTIETGESLMLGTQDSGKDPWLISLGISMPLWRKKNRSRVREAELNQESASENKEWMETQVIANLKKIYFRMENSRRLVELYENSLIPQAEKTIEIAETWHQEGEPKSIAGLLETQSVWLNFNLARARAIADYQQNRARLEQIAGGSLESVPE